MDGGRSGLNGWGEEWVEWMDGRSGLNGWMGGVG